MLYGIRARGGTAGTTLAGMSFPKPRAVLCYFPSLWDAQAHFKHSKERHLLEIYYPVEKRGEKLFS